MPEVGAVPKVATAAAPQTVRELDTGARYWGMGKWRATQDKDANCLFTIALRWDDCRLRRNDQFHEAAPRRHIGRGLFEQLVASDGFEPFADEAIGA